MIINLTNVRNLGKGFPKIRLVEMTSVVVEVRMGDILLVCSSPGRILPSLFSTDLQPLLQACNFLPHAISVDLASKTQLCMEPANLIVLLHNIFPYETHTTKTGSLIGIDIDREIISGCCDKSPVGFVSASDKELVASAAQMGGNSICPFRWGHLVHLNVNFVPVKCPPLVSGNVDGLQLSRVGGEIGALVEVNGWRLGSVGDEQN